MCMVVFIGRQELDKDPNLDFLCTKNSFALFLRQSSNTKIAKILDALGRVYILVPSRESFCAFTNSRGDKKLPKYV